MLAPAKNAAVTEFYTRFQRELATFEKELPLLIKQYPGEYVAIFNGEVVAHQEKWDEVAQFARDRFPDEFVLIEKVEPMEKISVDMDTLEG